MDRVVLVQKITTEKAVVEFLGLVIFRWGIGCRD